MSSMTSFLDEIKESVSYGTQVINDIETIHGVIRTFCADLTTVLQNQFDQLVIKCEYSLDLDESERGELYKTLFPKDDLNFVPFIFIKARKRITVGGNIGKSVPDLPSLSYSFQTYPLIRCRANEESGYPVYLIYNFEKVYCDSEKELRNELILALKARIADVLAFLKKI